MIGRPFRDESYQYHLLGMALQADDPRDYVHGQITALKTALMHPIIQRAPADLRTATLITRAIHAALGLVNVNFRDTPRPENLLTLTEPGEHGRRRLVVRYAPAPDEPARMKAATRKVRAALGKLNCIVPPGMAHMRPMGASVHYAGTMPMSSKPGPWSTNEHCQSREIDNLFLVDGTTFPFLPAKNITFTLMANATRVGQTAF